MHAISQKLIQQQTIVSRNQLVGFVMGMQQQNVPALRRQQRRGDRQPPVYAGEHVPERISLRGRPPRLIGPSGGPEDQALRPSRPFTMSLKMRPRSS